LAPPEGLLAPVESFAPPRAKYLHKNPRLETLIHDVAERFYLEPNDITEQNRSKSPTAARHVVMWVIRKTWSPQPSLPEIGVMLDRDHTTVISAVRRIDREISRGTDIGQIALKIGGLATVSEDT